MTNVFSKIPDNAPLPRKYQDDVARRLSLRHIVDPIDIGLGGTWLPHTVNFSVRKGTAWVGDTDEKRPVISVVEINVYGEVTWRGSQDSSSRTVLCRTDSRVTRRTESRIWNGHSYADLPEGRRKRISELAEILLGDVDWDRLVVEIQERDHALERNRHLAEARRSVEEYLRLGDEPTILPTRVEVAS